METLSATGWRRQRPTLSAGTEPDIASTPKKRRGRIASSCAECRRLKLKCDRSVPCENCVKRGCEDHCPDRAREAARVPAREAQRSNELQLEVDALKDLLAMHGIQSGLSRKHSDHGLTPNRVLVENGVADSARESEPPRKRQRRVPTKQSSSMTVSGDSPSTDNAGLGRQHSFTASVDREDLQMTADHTRGDAHEIETPNETFTREDTASAWLDQYTTSEPPTTDYTQSGLQPILDLQGHSAGDLDQSDQSGNPGMGTLVMSHTGRSKYLGPSAASEWLKDQEAPDVSGPSSPVMGGRSRALTPPPVRSTNDPIADLFPFPADVPTGRPHHLSFDALLSALPDEDELEAMVEAYYRYFAWSYSSITRPALRDIVSRARKRTLLRSSPNDVQQLGLLYIVLAMGVAQNLALAPGDYLGDEYYSYSKECLTKGNFMIHNTLAGVQTLSVMAHYLLGTDKGRDGDSAWPLWGLAMRLAQAMGLHRDGAQWGLAADVVDDRRRVFWECHSVEVFQANCFSRPTSIAPEFVDVRYPSDIAEWHRLKLDLSRLSQSVLYAVLSVKPVPLTRLDELNNELIAFERNIPFNLRCRAAVEAIASVYSDVAKARLEAPEVTRRAVRLVLEQHFLAMIVSETVVNLYRQLFVRALAESPDDPVRSVYGRPFLSVFERSVALVEIMCSLYNVLPAVAARHWWCWYHAFNSAVCMGTLIIMSPRNAFAPAALAQIDKVISIYTACIQLRASRRLVQNLRWLLRLRQRATNRMSVPTLVPNRPSGGGDETSDDEVDTSLLGWKTRLIERASRGNQTAKTVSAGTPGSVTSSTVDVRWAAENVIDQVINSMPMAVQQHVASVGTGAENDPSANFMFDFFGANSENYFGFDNGGGAGAGAGAGAGTGMGSSVAPNVTGNTGVLEGIVSHSQPSDTAGLGTNMLQQFWEPTLLMQSGETGAGMNSDWWNLFEDTS